MSDEIKNAFENYFKKSGENKMDMQDFYKIIETSEVDVEASCSTLYKQHFKNPIARACCKGICKRKRDIESAEHVETFDQIESEKHMY